MEGILVFILLTVAHLCSTFGRLFDCIFNLALIESIHGVHERQLDMAEVIVLFLFYYVLAPNVTDEREQTACAG